MKELKVKVIIAALKGQDIITKEFELETVDSHTGEDILMTVFASVSMNDLIPLALISDDERVQSEWDKVSKESATARSESKATCSDEEFDRINKLEERIKEANAMLNKELNNNNGGNEMKEELNTIVDTTFEEVEAELKAMAESLELAQKSLSEKALKEVFTTKDGDAYKVLLDKLDKSYESTKSFLGDCAVVKEIANRNNDVKNKVNEFLAKHGNTEKVVAIIGGLIRKIAASLLGLAKFTFETIALLATMVLRIGFVIGEEVIDTTVAIGGSFNKNVLGLFKRKK